MLMTSRMREVFERLRLQLGVQRWWPADSEFEMMLGAILVQNTKWHNVTLSVARLRDLGLLDARAWAQSADELILYAIHSCGFHTSKLRATRAIADWYVRIGEAEVQDAMIETSDLRADLLTLPGVGSETADAILLYAFGRPVFIYDAYSRKMFAEVFDLDAPTYQRAERLASRFVAEAEFTPEEFSELHALIDEYGKLVQSGINSWAALLSPTGFGEPASRCY